MTIPKKNQIYLPFLKTVSRGGEIKLKEVINLLANNFELTEVEREERYPSRNRDKIFDTRVHFSRLELLKAELISSPRRGFVKISDTGTEFLETNPISLTQKELLQFKPYKEYKEKLRNKSKKSSVLESTGTGTSEEEIEEDMMERAYAGLNEKLKIEILEKILANSPAFFENLVVDLLIKMGYGGSREEAGESVGKSHDGGIDGIIKEDILGLDVIYIQAKRYSNTNAIGSPDIQKFAGALDGRGAKKGIFITTSQFSREAIKEAVGNINKKIVLIDGDTLANYMIKHNLGTSTDHTYKIKSIDSDFFEEG